MHAARQGRRAVSECSTGFDIGPERGGRARRSAGKKRV